MSFQMQFSTVHGESAGASPKNSITTKNAYKDLPADKLFAFCKARGIRVEAGLENSASTLRNLLKKRDINDHPYVDYTVSELRSIRDRRGIRSRSANQEDVIAALEAADTEKGFRFTDLPAEIRNRIYRYTITQANMIRRTKANNDPTVSRIAGTFYTDTYFENNTGPLVQHPITRVSHQLRQESLPVFYSLRAFPLHRAPLTTWLTTDSSKEQLKNITAFFIEKPLLWTTPGPNLRVTFNFWREKKETHWGLVCPNRRGVEDGLRDDCAKHLDEMCKNLGNFRLNDIYGLVDLLEQYFGRM